MPIETCRDARNVTAAVRRKGISGTHGPHRRFGIALKIWPVSVLIALNAAPASASCAKLPDRVATYISQQVGWHIVTNAILGEDQTQPGERRFQRIYP
jgi:hypothetical protein